MTHTTSPEQLQIWHFTQWLGQTAGRFLLKKWHEPRQLTSKGFRDFVTDADIASQKLITDAIQAQFPTHGFLTEEDDQTLPTGREWLWIIDPVDGTSNYSRLLGNFSVSIAAARQTDPAGGWQVQAGTVYDPVRDELFTAALGQGAWLGEKQLQVSPITNLPEAIVSLDWSHGPNSRQHTLNALNKVAVEVRTVRALGSAALAMAWVAAGRLEAYFNLHLQPWDSAAGQLLIHEAGGLVTNQQGEKWQLEHRFSLASNQHLHPALLACFPPAKSH